MRGTEDMKGCAHTCLLLCSFYLHVSSNHNREQKPDPAVEVRPCKELVCHFGKYLLALFYKTLSLHYPQCNSQACGSDSDLSVVLAAANVAKAASFKQRLGVSYKGLVSW